MVYKFVLKSKICELERLYSWLDKLLNRRRVDISLAQRILLVSQELATNSILHGNRKVPTRKVYIGLSITPKRVILDVLDEGSRVFKLPTKKQATKLDYLKECGRGLKLAVLMSSRIKLNSNGLRVYFDNIK